MKQNENQYKLPDPRSKTQNPDCFKLCQMRLIGIIQEVYQKVVSDFTGHTITN
jgi:Tfp pilus assembly protein PilP